jgi:hypothetical protein
MVRRPFQKPKEIIRDMPRIPNSVNRQRRLFAMIEPSVNLPAEDRRELQMALADLLLNAVAGSSRGTAPVHNERSTEDEFKIDR